MPSIVRKVGQSRVGPGQSQVLISDGEKLIVTSVLCTAAAANGVVMLLRATDFTRLTTIRTPANSSFQALTAFPAITGLAVTTDANSECTIFYTVLREVP